MKTDNVITLSNGVNYLLLDELKLHDERYFFCVKVNAEKTKPINEYCFVKEDKKNGKLFANIIRENSVIKKLYDELIKVYCVNEDSKSGV